jgi:hypothetical protein
MATKKRNKKRWIQKSRERMEEKGTVGSFGKATPKKISRAIAHGGKMAKKAQWIKNIQKGRKKKARSSGR